MPIPKHSDGSFRYFSMLYDQVFIILALSSELGTHTRTHTAKKLVIDQETAKSSSTDASTTYP